MPALLVLLSLLPISIAAAQLPPVSDRPPVPIEHFPSDAHAFVWRNWNLIPTQRLAEVLDTTPDNVLRMGRAMGLGETPAISDELRKRSYITVIRRNWHLLPYEQLVQLLGVTESELAFTLREDDFLYIKLGSMKPNAPRVRYEAPSPEIIARERAIAVELAAAFPQASVPTPEPLFHFVSELSKPLDTPPTPLESRFAPRFCSSYFALFGDALIEEDIDPFPDGYIQRLVASGVDSLWMHVVLYQLAPFSWDASVSEKHAQRLERLQRITERLAKHGVGLYLYMNEPRAMPLAFFEGREELKGVVQGDHAALCTSVPEVRAYLADSIATILRAAPKLKGLFTITASENFTSCWSHNQGAQCPRCGARTPAEVIAELNGTLLEGIQRAESGAELIAWDWGWRDEWALDAIARLPREIRFQSVSEWSIPINRGGVETTVGEYSISAIGPGPRATRHWAAARERGLKTNAKIQAGNTWELAAVPYIPAVANVAQHALNLLDANVDGIMLGWSLGGYPSPNLQVVAEIARPTEGGPVSVNDAMLRVATSRYGASAAPHVVRAWEQCSTAFSQFPYDGSVVYRAPLQAGPANLLYSAPTGYASTMVGFGYDDLAGWRGPYPPDVFIGQLTIVADGFDAALDSLRAGIGTDVSAELQRELNVMEAAAIHFRSVALQARFVALRDTLAASPSLESVSELEAILRNERELALRLHAIQSRDSRIGFEASNHYFYIPADLAEKALTCSHLLNNWIPALRNRN